MIMFALSGPALQANDLRVWSLPVFVGEEITVFTTSSSRTATQTLPRPSSQRLVALNEHKDAQTEEVRNRRGSLKLRTRFHNFKWSFRKVWWVSLGRH